MSASGRTPGEWYAEWSEGVHSYTVNSRDPSGDGEDCWLADLGAGNECVETDARLMAAAPDLYAALAALRDAIHIETDATRNERLMTQVRAALAKAGGREPQP